MAELSRILAVDIGGTFIKYAVMTPDGEMLTRGKTPTPVTGREQEINVIGKIFSENPADAVAVSMPGIIDTDRGYCSLGGAIRYNEGFFIRDAIEQRCGVPCTVENDAKCAAMAESSMGALKDVNDGFVITLGSMIGGGYIKDRKLHRGAHFSAGEVSYITTDRCGVPGYNGIWGNRCSVRTLCADFAGRKGLSSVSGEEVFEFMAQGDPDAIEAVKAFSYEIAVQIFNIQTVLDVEKFAIGGGISARSEMIDSIRESLDEMYAACPYPVTRAVVVQAAFLNDANLIGALQCVLDKYKLT